MDDNLLTVQQVADRCYVSVETVRRWIKNDGLAAMKLGHRTVRIRPADLAEFLSRAA